MHDSKYCDLSGLLTFASTPLTCFDSAGVWVLFHQQVTMCLLSFNLQGQGLHLGRKHPRGLLAFSCHCQCPLRSPAPTSLHWPGLKELQGACRDTRGHRQGCRPTQVDALGCRTYTKQPPLQPHRKVASRGPGPYSRRRVLQQVLHALMSEALPEEAA